jgi:hypothetical protein
MPIRTGYTIGGYGLNIGIETFSDEAALVTFAADAGRLPSIRSEKVIASKRLSFDFTTFRFFPEGN